MEIFPAIDLQDSQVVSLTQGDFGRKEIYAADPCLIARQFIDAGAKNLHMVDLDGAKRGEPTNFDAIRAIVEQGGLFVEIGGGIRDEARICQYLELGVGRVILGTIAVEDFAFTCDMIKKYGDKIAVGVDALNGKVATRAWLDNTDVESVPFCQKLCDAGVSTIIYTDIAKDGAMQGTNLAVYQELEEKLSCDIIASGGISSMEDIHGLLEIGVYGAILGKAIYIGALNLKEVISLC